MDALFPTKTRLALLRDIAAGRVFQDVIGDSYIDGAAKVTARVAEFEAAEWAELVAAGPYGGGDLPRWKLKPAGEAALAEHTQNQKG